MRERAGEVIRAAVLAGTTAIRSHVDVDTTGGLKGLRGVVRAAGWWRSPRSSGGS